MIKIATGLIKKFMEVNKFAGWTSIWGDIYVMPGYEKDERLIKHEQVHLEQIKREGKVSFMYNYTKELIKHGYTKNKYEIEARNKS